MTDFIKALEAARAQLIDAQDAHDTLVLDAIKSACPGITGVSAQWEMDDGFAASIALTVQIGSVTITTRHLDYSDMMCGPHGPRPMTNAHEGGMFSDLTDLREIAVLTAAVKDWQQFYRALSAWAHTPGGRPQPPHGWDA